MNYAIILAGGIGSRFWPLSRVLFPKQFIKIKGKATPFQQAIKRLKGIIESKNIYIITNKIYLPLIKKQIKKFSIPHKNIVLEPYPLNTAPAISLCAQLISSIDKDALLLILQSDHYIKGNKNFKKVILKEMAVAKKDFLVILGIKPNRPHMGYGYIRIKDKLTEDAFKVRYFIEKPNIQKAKRIYKRKDIYWNAGFFCWKAKVFLRELKKYLPNLYFQISQIKKKSDIARIWPRIKPISIDYGLLEKTKKIALVPARFAWTDLGSWDALCEILPKDKNSNIILADSVNLDSKNTIVLSKSKRLIATVGLKNLIIIDTPDALLVCDKDKSQQIKTLVECLKRKKRKECIKMPSL